MTADLTFPPPHLPSQYIYFDWENSWCQRKKADFRFEYRYLSEDN